MPPKAAAAAARIVGQPDVHFDVSLDRVKQYADRAQTTAERFLRDRRGAKYLVVAVDPAGGGELSEEAFVVFLVAGDQIALVTARAIRGHDARYDYSTVPLVFVLALLETVRCVKAMLVEEYRRLQTEFVMPPVLVVMETNFAYGAAVYMQLDWFIRYKLARHPSLSDIKIIFATPVYVWDSTVEQARKEAAELRRLIDDAEPRVQQRYQEAYEIWKAKGKRRGANWPETLENVFRDLRENAEVNSSEAVARLLEGIRTKVTEANQGTKKSWDKEPGAWDFLAQLQEKLTAFVDLRRQVRVHRLDLTNITQKVNERAKGAVGLREGPADLFRARAWPHAGGEDVAKRIAIPDKFWSAAPKTAMGENTTAEEKVRAFQHWLSLPRCALSLPLECAPRTPMRERDGPPRLHLLLLRRATPDPPDVFSAAGGDVCRQVLTGPGRVDRLPSARLVLRCVYQQWRRLSVEVADDGTVQRVEGKQPGGADGGGVTHDDVWMAFSIGLQWCSRFAVLLPTDEHRGQLVQYMRDVRKLVKQSIRQVLDDVQEPDGDASTVPTAAPPPGTAPRRPPPALPDEDVDALAVVAAATNAAVIALRAVRELLRRLVVACVVAGLRPEGGYAVHTRKVTRRAPRGGPRFWQERVLAELRREGVVAGTVDEVARVFGREVVTLRLVCGTAPGPRFAWPGVSATRKRAATDTFAAQLDACTGRLDTVFERVGAASADHCARHPVLAADQTRQVLEGLLDRARGVVVTVHSLTTAEDWRAQPVAALADESLGALSQRLVDMPPAPAAAVATSLLPLQLLTMYSQTMEDLAFLRRLDTFNRSRLLPLLLARSDRLWQVDTVEPGVLCRAHRRSTVAWRHAFSVMWPQRMRQVVEAVDGPERVVYQSHITLR